MSFDLQIKGGNLLIDKNTGDIAQVTGVYKLVQDILKILTTRLGSNRFYPWYGFIDASIGGAIDDTMNANILRDQLNVAIEKFVEIQKDQIKNGQKLSADEQLAAIRNINISNDLDPRFFLVNIRIITKSMKEQDIKFKLLN